MGNLLNLASSLWRRHRFLFLAFITALVVTLFFAARLLVATVYWADPDHHDQPLEGWMTPRYVAHSYDLPSGMVHDILGLETTDGERRTLAEIVKTSDLTIEEIQQRVDEARRSSGSDAQ
mgnify:CR=1 FL=1